MADSFSTRPAAAASFVVVVVVYLLAFGVRICVSPTHRIPNLGATMVMPYSVE
jgi:hypothetical protein